MDILDALAAGRLVNTVNSKTRNDNSEDNDAHSLPAERERELVPAVTLTSVKWASALVPGHLRRA